MPPLAVKTIRDIIFWEYAKLIAESAHIAKTQYGFVMSKFKALQTNAVQWSDILREDFKISHTKCAYCGSPENLSKDHIVPKRDCHFAENHNIVLACQTCNSSKSNKDLIEWYGLGRIAKIPRIVMGKYLKMLYVCHNCRGTLEKSDLNMDGKFNLLDLGWIFKQRCGGGEEKI